MDHFSEEDWVGLARGFLPEKGREKEMRAHLDGCQDCLATYRLARTVVEATTREPLYAPPESSVRAVESLYRLQRPRVRPVDLIQAARLVFDSFREPLPIGVRTLGRPVRQLLYKARACYVAMRIEQQPRSTSATVVGQAVRYPDWRKGMRRLPVTLWHRKASVAETTTNDLGEFSFEIDTGRNHRLSIVVDGDTSVTVPIRRWRVGEDSERVSEDSKGEES